MPELQPPLAKTSRARDGSWQDMSWNPYYLKRTIIINSGLFILLSKKENSWLIHYEKLHIFIWAYIDTCSVLTLYPIVLQQIMCWSSQAVWFQDVTSPKGDARVVRWGGGRADSQCDTGQSQPCDLVSTLGRLDRWFNSICCLFVENGLL